MRISFGAVWRDRRRPCLQGGKRGSASASQCRKRARSLRLFPETVCLRGNAIGRPVAFFVRSAHGPVRLRRSMIETHIK
jgi:hypothetical protein